MNIAFWRASLLPALLLVFLSPVSVLLLNGSLEDTLHGASSFSSSRYSADFMYEATHCEVGARAVQICVLQFCLPSEI